MTTKVAVVKVTYSAGKVTCITVPDVFDGPGAEARAKAFAMTNSVVPRRVEDRTEFQVCLVGHGREHLPGKGTAA